MSIKPWTIRLTKKATIVATVVLDGGDSSSYLNLPDYPDKTVHVFGTFGDSAVSLKGSNDEGGNAQNLHRTDDPTTTYSALVAETLGHIIENPNLLVANATGATGDGLTVAIICTG
jgi:hypothetical protein